MRSKDMLRLFAAGVIACVLQAEQVAQAQAVGALPTYDVTTVKVHKPGEISSMWSAHGATFTGRNVPLKNLLSFAYGVRSWLVFGLPAWAESTRYDIEGKISDADPEKVKKLSMKDVNAMVAALLKDRFGLQAHVETKVLPVYELTVVSTGPSFHESPPAPKAVEGEPAPKSRGGWMVSSGHMKATETTMALIAETMGNQAERFIVDKTGLTGHYDIELKWTPEDEAGKSHDNGLAEDAPLNFFSAVKEQLGLQLKSAKGPQPTLVVDTIEPPKDN